MRQKENYTPFIAVALGLTFAILGSFQIYILREPTRIASDEASDKSTAVSEGHVLFAQYCTVCHGKEGEGVDAPALNDSNFLKESGDERIFSLISSGVPGTEMPAWSQRHGGPFTDQQVSQLVAFIRAWEPTAPDRQAEALQGDPAKGLVIFNSTCIICHGEQGLGTDRAPALNDPVKLGQFDDQWYIDTISAGRPAQGMPTWGTVLSPAEIRDLVALLRAWGNGEDVQIPGLEENLKEALQALQDGDLHNAEHMLEEAAQSASGEVLDLINKALEAIDAGDQAAAIDAVERAQELLGAGG